MNALKGVGYRHYIDVTFELIRGVICYNNSELHFRFYFIEVLTNRDIDVIQKHSSRCIKTLNTFIALRIAYKSCMQILNGFCFLFFLSWGFSLKVHFTADCRAADQLQFTLRDRVAL